MWLGSPIPHWAVVDVWAYIVSHGCVYDAAYDRMSDAGIPIEAQRIGPFANRRALRVGQLEILKMVFPEQFTRFVHEIPDTVRFL